MAGSKLTRATQADIAVALAASMSMSECARRFDTTRDRVRIVARDAGLLNIRELSRDLRALQARIIKCQSELVELHQQETVLRTEISTEVAHSEGST